MGFLPNIFARDGMTKKTNIEPSHDKKKAVRIITKFVVIALAVG